MTAERRVIGRFAPSPTGPLHFGSVVAALGSFLHARSARGNWHVRMDDIDPPREVPGSADRILAQLEALGLHWDAAVLYQSTRREAYREGLAALRGKGAVYRCECTRRALRDAPVGPLGPIYPGTCRDRRIPADRPGAIRLRLPRDLPVIDDAYQGRYTHTGPALGDPVVHRRDGLSAYHLATTLDDAHLGVTDVVRGADLLPSAVIQAELQTVLGLGPVRWHHLPLAVDAQGVKLGKHAGAAAIDTSAPLPVLLAAWAFLGQIPPDEAPGTLAEFHAFAASAWDADRVPVGPLTVTSPDDSAR